MKIKLSQKQFNALKKGQKLVGQIEELDRCRPHIGTFRYAERRNTLVRRLEEVVSSQAEEFSISLLGAPTNNPKIVQYLQRK